MKVTDVKRYQILFNPLIDFKSKNMENIKNMDELLSNLDVKTVEIENEIDIIISEKDIEAETQYELETALIEDDDDEFARLNADIFENIINKI